jgi:hypothetical protein
MYAYKMHANEVYPHNMHARDMHAHKTHVYEMHALSGACPLSVSDARP